MPEDTRVIRVALATLDAGILVGATANFAWYDQNGNFLVSGRPGAAWRIERETNGVRLRAVAGGGRDGVATPWQRSLIARATLRGDGGGFVTINGKRYRGEAVLLPVDSAGGVIAVNRLGLEDYLRGVVPVEMGRRPRGDSSALQAQAVASRSYALARSTDRNVAYDVRATTSDQVYGGVDVENDEANDAIDATRGLVLTIQGRIADAPFHSTCGGATAAASEVWRTGGGLAYLESVSDQIPGTDHYYCDIAPRYRWTRSLSGSQLNAALAQYLAAYAAVPGGRPGIARTIGVRDRTASGRVATLDVETDKGIFALRGNDMRYVMREPGGEILYSTYFSVEPEYRDGVVSRVTFRGQGYGHGVGMCQWGAIGRARAGQSFRSILGTYYPGTTVGLVSVQ